MARPVRSGDLQGLRRWNLAIGQVTWCLVNLAGRRYPSLGGVGEQYHFFLSGRVFGRKTRLECFRSTPVQFTFVSCFFKELNQGLSPLVYTRPTFTRERDIQLPRGQLRASHSVIMPRKAIDSRIPALIRNGVQEKKRSFFVVVGDRQKMSLCTCTTSCQRRREAKQVRALGIQEGPARLHESSQEARERRSRRKSSEASANRTEDPFELFVTLTQHPICLLQGDGEDSG